MKELSVPLSEKQALAMNTLLNDPDITEVFYGGAAGGGKSYIGCIWCIYCALTYPETRGLIGRAVRNNLYLTTLNTFKKVWNKYFQYNSSGVTFTINEKRNVIFFSNGSEIILKDLFHKPSDQNMDDYGSLELSYAFIDEVTEIKEQIFDVVKSRIRHNLINDKQMILSCSNPSHNWVKFRYFYDVDGKPVKLPKFRMAIAAKVDDNPDKKFVRIYKANLEQMPDYLRQRLLDGNWLYVNVDSPFLYEFDEHENVVPITEIDDRQTILFSFDFNYNPCTCVVSQLLPYDIEQNGGLHFITDFAVKGGTAALCDRILQVFDMDDIRHLVRVTGDNSGVKKSSTAGNRSDYAIIKDKFQINDNSLIDVRTANLRHVDSQRLCNYTHTHIPVYFDAKKCKQTIQDVRFAQMINDKILKDESKGIGMHLLDCYRYAINAHFLNGAKSVKKNAILIDPDYWKRKI